jgi:uridylate kinase
VIGELHDKGHGVYIVVGAGHMKKDYINVAKGVGLGDDDAHRIALQITHLNANLLRLSLGERAYKFLPTNTTDVISHSQRAKALKKVFVCGGTSRGSQLTGLRQTWRTRYTQTS